MLASVTFPQALQHQRKTQNISLRKLASMLGVDPAYLSRVESGKVRASEALIRSAATALRVDPEEWLLLAGRVPPSWQEAISASPEGALRSLRRAIVDRISDVEPSYGRTVLAFGGTRAIEDAAFPFEHLSDIAEMESWRKEINRPIYHLHKWWAQRLGSVFRAILLGVFAPKGSNVLEMFYQPARLPGAVVFDPFMGSGTTVGEALKLGANAIGRDINPVAYFAVRNALGVRDRREVIKAFHEIERDVAPTIRRSYQTRIPGAGLVDVLYYFWVKVIPCPRCNRRVDLFSSYVFARHAYPTRNPEARAVCPDCGAITTLRYDADRTVCRGCRGIFNPQSGCANGTKAYCRACDYTFTIVKAVQALGQRPDHRLYAKMVLKPDGSKEYLPAEEQDRALYEEASRALARRRNAYPVVPIEPGHNTDQVLKYCYRYWHEMFNDRQLLCLSLLADRIRKLPDPGTRDLFACLFSATLEFNNMFASFKGEGTGAVRHMFSHHILKPERMPLEANIWGTPRSSGAFSTLFSSRLLRTLDYADNPFELRVTSRNGKLVGDKLYGLSCRLSQQPASSFEEFDGGRQLYLSCGDSAETDIPAESLDAVVTDPPFFDNVHYSQLADFFYVWQRHLLGNGDFRGSHTTRSAAEVQQSDPSLFAERLGRVWKECHRVLRHEGLLVFTYHHSRGEGWKCVLKALSDSGFVIIAAHPMKAEMSVAAPKQQAKEPIDLDVILACRKRESVMARPQSTSRILSEALRSATEQVRRLNRAGRKLSRNDVRVVLTAQVITRISQVCEPTAAIGALERLEASIERAIGSLHGGQDVKRMSGTRTAPQLALFSDQASS